MKSKFKIKGLDCANCASQLERTIQKIEGVESVNISFMTQKMELEYDETRKEEIISGRRADPWKWVRSFLLPRHKEGRAFIGWVRHERRRM